MVRASLKNPYAVVAHSLIKIYFHPEYNVDAGLAEITSLTYSALRFI